MEIPIEILKSAFIAHVNDMRRFTVVDTHYKIIDGSAKLVLVFENGSEEIFKGVRAA